LKYRVHNKQLSRQQTYASPRGALVVAASKLAREFDLQDHPIHSESVEDWIAKLESEPIFKNGMLHLEATKQKGQAFKEKFFFKKTGLLKIVSIFDYLGKDFVRHSPILYRTFRHKIRLWGTDTN